MIFIWAIVIGVALSIFFNLQDEYNRKKCVDRINTKIDHAYSKVINAPLEHNPPAVAKVKSLMDFCSKAYGDALAKFEKEEELIKVENTKSSLGRCAVSKTHFYYDIDVWHTGAGGKIPKKLPDCEFYLEYINYVNSVHVKKSEYIPSESKMGNELCEVERIATEGCVGRAIVIPIDSIRYYGCSGDVQYTSEVSGGGANLAGAAVGGLLAGSAAAIVGSKIGTEVQTKTVKHDSRNLTIFYEKEGKIEALEITTNAGEALSALRKLIPQKEESVVQIESQQKGRHMVAATSSADEIKQFKELLDSGIISQEEFDAKKKQLLGL